MVGQIVSVQVGQCGNQLGLDFFGALAREGGQEAEDAYGPAGGCPLYRHLPAFFRESPSTRGRESSRSCCSTARAVLLDAEPRVVNNVASKTAPRAALSYQWQYPGDCSTAAC